jgi:hypothetical protein
VQQGQTIELSTLTIEQLKALAYDQICQRSAIDQAIAKIEQVLAMRQQQAATEKPAEVPNG